MKLFSLAFCFITIFSGCGTSIDFSKRKYRSGYNFSISKPQAKKIETHVDPPSVAMPSIKNIPTVSPPEILPFASADVVHPEKKFQSNTDRIKIHSDAHIRFEKAIADSTVTTENAEPKKIERNSLFALIFSIIAFAGILFDVLVITSFAAYVSSAVFTVVLVVSLLLSILALVQAIFGRRILKLERDRFHKASRLISNIALAMSIADLGIFVLAAIATILYFIILILLLHAIFS